MSTFKKKVLAFAFLGTALLVSYALIQGGKENTRSEKLSAALRTTETRNPSLNFTAGPVVAPVFTPKNTDDVSTANDSSVSDSDNLTDRFIKTYAGEIIKSNPDPQNALKSGKKLSTPSNAMLEKIIAEQLVQGPSIPLYALRDIKTSPDTSIKNMERYLAALGELEKKSQRENEKFQIQPEQLFGDEKSTSYQAYLNETLENYIYGLLALEAPSSWKELHLALLNLAQKKLSAYHDPFRQEEDPLKAIVAAYYLTTLLEESEDLSAVFEEQKNALLKS